MYTYTRQDAADLLWISTRSIDRYIKSGKLRSKKEWKIVYVNDDDIKNLSWWQDSKQEIIDKKPEKKTNWSERNKIRRERRKDFTKYL